MPAAPEFESLVKPSALSAARLLKMQEEEKDISGCSSPLSPSLSFFSPSPYILNCKRRACGAWETRDALSGVWGSRDGPAVKEEVGGVVKPSSTSAEAAETHLEKHAATAVAAVAAVHASSLGSSTRFGTLNDQLGDLRDALEKFITDCTYSREVQEEEKGALEPLGIDLQALRKKNVRGKILAEILSSRKVNSMELKVDQVSVRGNEGEEDFCSISEALDEEFFDAREASSDGYSSEESSSRKQRKRDSSLMIDTELLRQLQMEVKRRMRAEEALRSMQLCQEKIVKILLSPGCSTPMRSSSPQPVPPTIVDHGLASLIDEDWQDEDTSILTVISSALLKGMMRPDEAEALKKLLETKDHESSRLRRKLKFYEQVNHELSHKNQEATERARRLRKARQKWLHISAKCIVIGLAVGVSGTLLYWYVPWESMRSVKGQLVSSTKNEAQTPPEQQIV